MESIVEKVRTAGMAMLRWPIVNFQVEWNRQRWEDGIHYVEWCDS